LSLPLGRIGFASTLNLIARRFKHGGAIADTGGGPGRYMIELLKRGHRVTLVDLSPKNIDLAAKKAAEAGVTPHSLIVGDARDLSLLGESRFDGVLVLGPLYHVTERGERLDVLKSIGNLLAPDGVLIAAYLNAWGIAQSILSDAPGWFAKEASLKSLANGETFVGGGACSGFTECVWSTPDAARKELEDAGLRFSRRAEQKALQLDSRVRQRSWLRGIPRLSNKSLHSLLRRAECRNIDEPPITSFWRPQLPRADDATIDPALIFEPSPATACAVEST
jgi:SAM-dependent methyltransferase